MGFDIILYDSQSAADVTESFASNTTRLIVLGQVKLLFADIHCLFGASTVTRDIRRDPNNKITRVREQTARAAGEQTSRTVNELIAHVRLGKKKKTKTKTVSSI